MSLRLTAKRAFSCGPKAFAPSVKSGKNNQRDGPTVLDQIRAPPVDLKWLPAMIPESLNNESVGKVMAFTAGNMATLNSLSLPDLIKKEFDLSPRPSTVIRNETLRAKQLIDKVKTGDLKKNRIIYTGVAGSGKSFLLVQLVAYAKSTEFVTLYIPTAIPLIDSSADYEYLPNKKVFTQPTIITSLLEKFNAANKEAFEKIKLSKEYAFEGVKVNGTLSKLVAALPLLSSSNKNLVWDAFWAEIGVQEQFPVLFAIDEAQSLFKTSKYRDPSYVPIQSFGLDVPRTILEFISGDKSFKRGLVLLAPSKTTQVTSKVFTLHLTGALKKRTKYLSKIEENQVDDMYASILEGVSVQSIGAAFNPTEAKGVVDLFHAFKGVREEMTDKRFVEYFVSSSGNPREFVKTISKTIVE